MDPELYRAAKEGNLEVLLQQKEQLEAQVTPNKNSVLHVAALFNKSDIVKDILTAEPLLLRRVNIKGDTALHIAAREGHCSTVQALIEYANEVDDSEVENGIGMAKYLLRMVNNDGNMALHEAVWNKDHLNIVNLLVEADPNFPHPANNDEETPLYIAVERRFDEIVSSILGTCTSPGYSGPDGKTALHAAVISDSEDCTRQLLQWKPSLAKESDRDGWTPLHYAVVHYHFGRARQLLDADKSIAYLTTHEEKWTPLHLIAISYNWRGSKEMMKVLILYCPDCWEMVDSKGQNILHLASSYCEWGVVDFILEDSTLSSLINQKNDEGNTPLHLLAIRLGDKSDYVDKDSAIKMIKDRRVDKSAYNKDKLTPYDVVAHKHISSELQADTYYLLGNYSPEPGARQTGRNRLVKRPIDFKAREPEEKPEPLLKRFMKIGDTHLIVAAFIATVTFAAGFTIPGGYDGNEVPNQGMAVLSRATAFKAFVIFDTIAMILSTCAVFIHTIAAFYSDEDKFGSRIIIAYLFVLLAIIAMMVAFMTGLYVVLSHSLALAISVCSIVSFSFILFFYLFGKLFRDASSGELFQ